MSIYFGHGQTSKTYFFCFVPFVLAFTPSFISYFLLSHTWLGLHSIWYKFCQKMIIFCIQIPGHLKVVSDQTPSSHSSVASSSFSLQVRLAMSPCRYIPSSWSVPNGAEQGAKQGINVWHGLLVTLRFFVENRWNRRKSLLKID